MSMAARGALNTEEKESDLRSRMLRSRYAELAYCRVMRGRAAARGDKRRVEFYQGDAERARRCVESLLNPRRLGRVVFPEIRAEVRRWSEIDRRRHMPW
jgi:hypothetical protein